jgi:hypothetical protein
VVVRSTTDCSGTSDDNGTVYVRIERASSLDSKYSSCSYDVTITVD